MARMTRTSADPIRGMSLTLQVGLQGIVLQERAVVVPQLQPPVERYDSDFHGPRNKGSEGVTVGRGPPFRPQTAHRYSWAS